MSMLCAAVGISNLVTMNVMERNKEIGIMKVVDATDMEVILLIMGEILLTAIIGGCAADCYPHYCPVFRALSRMFIAALAIAIGATVLFGMLTIYDDIPRQLGREMRSYGANMILVPPGETSNIDLDDVENAVTLLPESKVIGATPYRYEAMRINRQPITAVGTDFALAQKTAPTGRWKGMPPGGRTICWERSAFPIWPMPIRRSFPAARCAALLSPGH